MRCLTATAPRAAGTAAVGSVTDAPVGPKEEALWLLQQLAPDLGLANLPIALRLERALRWWPLQATLDWIAGRHPALRARFPVAGGHPVRRVVPAGQARVPLEPGTTTEETLAADVARVSAAAFNLERDLPVRASQLLLPDGGAVLVTTFHHIAFDAPSVPLFTEELRLGYESFAATGAAPSGVAPPPSGPGPDPAVSTETVAWWRERLEGAREATMRLHGCRPDPLEPTFQGGLVSFTLSPEAKAGVERLRRGLRASDNIILLSGLFLLLLCHGAGPDLVVGTPVSTRRSAEDARRIGYHLHTLALRVLADPAAGFDHLASLVREAFLVALDHYELPFEALLPHLGLGRGATGWRAPLFRHAFNYWVVSSTPLRLGGGEARLLPLNHGLCRLDIELSVGHAQGELRLQAAYNADVHDAWQVEAMLERYDALLRHAAADPARPVAELRAWGPRDVAVVRGANRTTRDWGARSVPELIMERAAQAPTAAAVVDGAGGESARSETTTYADLASQAAALAARLREEGVRPGEVVALAGDRGAALAAAGLGAWIAGAAYLPLDLTYPPERLAFSLDDAGVRVVVGDAKALPPACRRTRRLVAIPAGWRGGEVAAPGRAMPGGDAPAYVIYTSGSTGRPKGVLVTHRNLHNVVAYFADLLGIGDQDAVLWLTTFAFDISALELWLPLTRGGRMVAAPDEAQTDPKLLVDLVERHAVTVVQATPTSWRLFAPHLGGRLAGVRLLCGGEPLSAALARRLLDSGGRLFNVYGPTETTIWSTAAEVRGPVADPVGIGRPIANTRAHVLDRRGLELPPGIPGELCIGGDGVARGYLRRVELTAERFREHPGLGRLYHTGDTARWRPDGTLELLGRADRQIKLRGHRIELGEVEAVLEAHPEVIAAAVVLSGDPTGDGRLLATVQAQDRPGLAGELWVHASGKLPSFAVPAAIAVVKALPRTANGKVDYRALPAIDAPLTKSARPAGALDGPALDGRIGVLVRLWRELLDDSDLGPDANFFIHGGHSLLAAQLVGRVEELTGTRLKLAAVFQAPTPAALAALLDHLPAHATARRSGQ